MLLHRDKYYGGGAVKERCYNIYLCSVIGKWEVEEGYHPPSMSPKAVNPCNVLPSRIETLNYLETRGSV